MRRITQGLVLLLVLGLSVGLMSCGGDDDDEDISGNFQGTVTEIDASGQPTRQGSIVVNLNQNGNNLNGSYTTVIGAIGQSSIGNGNLSGVINGSVVSLTATSSSGCVYVVNASVDDDDFDGTFVGTSGCLGGFFSTSR
jgi:hypothetical protein